MTIDNIFRDYKNQLWGRRRPSAKAIRLGPIAIQLEKLSRDGFTPGEAIEILQTRHGGDLSREELAGVQARLPPRISSRGMEAEEQLENLPRQEPTPDQQLLQRETQEQRERTLAILRSVLNDLPTEDQLLLKMRAEGVKISEMARTLRVEQKPLYRRIARIMKELRLRLEKRGVSAQQVQEGLFGFLDAGEP